MANLFSSLSKGIRKAYRKAEGFIEEEREIPISQVFLNATLKRYVTDKVEVIQDLHAELHQDWLRLYCTVSAKGLTTDLSVDLNLLQMLLNKDTQLIVFEQITQTQVISATFKNNLQKLLLKSALFFYQKMLKKDPLGPILQHFEVVTQQDGLLYLDLNRWLGDKRSVIESLRKLHVNHAEVRDGKLIMMGNLKLNALFSKSRDWQSLADASEELLDVSDSASENGELDATRPRSGDGNSA